MRILKDFQENAQESFLWEFSKMFGFSTFFNDTFVRLLLSICVTHLSSKGEVVYFLHERRNSWPNKVCGQLKKLTTSERVIFYWKVCNKASFLSSGTVVCGKLWVSCLKVRHMYVILTILYVLSCKLNFKLFWLLR